MQPNGDKIQLSVRNTKLSLTDNEFVAVVVHVFKYSNDE
jgi:hypothetical protein